MSDDITRRSALQKLSALGAAAALPIQQTLGRLPGSSGRDSQVKHSACKWCYSDMTVAELAEAGREVGLQSIELVGPEAWPTLKEYGLSCAMSNVPEMSLTEGWNRVANHEHLIPKYEERIQEVADAGFQNVICFSGNRRDGLTDEEGIANCAQGLKQIMPTAEEHGVVVCMELLNSKIDHPGYMCDHTDWGVKLAERIGSENFKLLYDIYHMQIMEGDVIRTIRNNHEYIGHYHTGGVPGRHMIDESQELYYPAILRAIEETGYEGYLGQEYIPTRDPIALLKEAIDICTV